MGEYTRAAAIGLKSFITAVAGWSENPYTDPVGRRLWGRIPTLNLAALTLVAIVGGVFFPTFSQIARFFPPFSFLIWIPGDVQVILWSMPAVFGWVVAWRVRSLRSDDENSWFDIVDVAQPGRRIFEAAAIPIGAAAAALAVGLEIGPRLYQTILGNPVEWSSVGRHLVGASESFIVVLVVAGVVLVNRNISNAFGQLLGVGFTLFGIRMGIGYAAPWLTSWWTYLPIPYVDRLTPDRSPLFAFFIFNLAVAAVAWVSLRERADQSPFYGSVEETIEDDEAS